MNLTQSAKTILLIKDAQIPPLLRGGCSETGRETDRLKQLSKWLFAAPRVPCFGEIINCIIRTPVIHRLFVPSAAGCQ